MRRIGLASYGLAIGACYTALLQAGFPGETTLLPVRGVFVVLFMVVYGWCSGRDPLLSTQRLLIEIPLIPLALIAAVLAGIVCLPWFLITRLSMVFTGRRTGS